jgi:hypothetical protein
MEHIQRNPQHKLNCQEILISAPQGRYSMTKALFNPLSTHSCLNLCWSWASEFKRIVMGDGNCTTTESRGGTYFLQNDNTDKLTNTRGESNNLYAMLYNWMQMMLAQSTRWTRGVSQCGLAIYIKKYLKSKKKNYGNSNISLCKNVVFKKIPLEETKILQDIITL